MTPRTMHDSYKTLELVPEVGDHVLVMKGVGPGGTVLGTWERYAVVQLNESHSMPILVEPEAMLLLERDDVDMGR